MYLKVIELNGFKSFAERTRIELNRDFTAIVGPNGSGKSNIIEAIQWVLGEQSARTLRGEHMDDIIFAGSSAHARAQYAEVALEFDNTDGTLPIDAETVRAVRRYTRSGDSYYSLNGKRCRLKDISDLMLDTGIGKHAFSVISQGKVEAVFNQKATERRQIIEEAAGVIKYKVRKRETEQKLQRTLDNQDRLNDIITELEDQREPLAAQRDTALRYQALKQQLSDVEVALFVHNIERENRRWRAAKEERQKAEAALTEVKDAIASGEAETEARKNELAEARTAQTATEQELDALDAAIETSERTLALLAQRRDFFEQTRAERRQQTDTLTQELETMAETLAQAEEALTAVQAETDAQQQQLDALKQQGEALADPSAEQVETLRDAYFDALQMENRLKNRVQALTQDLERTQAQRQRQADARQAKQQQQQSLAETQRQQAEQLAAAKEKLTALRAELAESEQRRETAKQQVADAEARLNAVRQRGMNQMAQLRSLRQLDASHQGFYAGVRNALKTKRADVYGTVADLIDVPTPYTQAVEAALGSQMQNIVTANGEAAEAVIQTLKQTHGGRATFLPLDSLQVRELSANERTRLQQAPGFRGVLADLVTFDTRYTPAMRFLMATTLVADDLRTARQLSRLLNGRRRVVTLAGDLVNAGGSLTGGARQRNQQSDILARKQQLKQLEAVVRKLARAERQAQAALEQARAAQETLSADSSAQKDACYEQQYQVTVLERAQAETERQLAALSDDLQADAALLEALDAEQRDAAQERAECKHEREAASERAQVLANEIKTATQSAQERQTKRNAWQEQWQAAQTQAAVLSEQQKQKQERVDTLRARLEEERQRLATLRQQTADAERDEQARATEEANTQATLAEQQQQRTAVQQQVERERQTIAQLERAVRELEQQTRAQNQQLEALYQHKATLDATIAQAETALDQWLAQLNEQYGLTYEKAAVDAAPLTDSDGAKADVRRLKREIQSLGPVNLQAIDAYEALDQRYTFLLQQRDDVLRAVDNLKQAMQTLDRTVAERFEATFYAVRDAFSRIFPQLFGGGKATLELTDPDDMLTTGVEILAQPPGKKLQLLSLLSGGERALTVIALLFALIEVEPVPYCILDEVEAALDEANVKRYGEYLRHYAAKTQFIVITHRKGTMAAANILYGVTMEQAGVSKLASVRLADVDAPA